MTLTVMKRGILVFCFWSAGKILYKSENEQDIYVLATQKPNSIM